MNTFLSRPAARRLLSTALLLLAGPLAAADIVLPAPSGNGVDITRILAARHETSAFSGAALPAQAVSDILWASTGINRPVSGGRTSNYSFRSRDEEIFLLCAQGVFLYDQLEHQLTFKSATDLRPTLGGAASTAPLTLVLVSYNGGINTEGSIHTGFIAENIALACADRGLGARLTAEVPAGLSSALGLAGNHVILLLQTVGFPEGTPVTGPAWAIGAGPMVPAAVNDAPALAILKRRRSTNDYVTTALSDQFLGDLVWAGLGVNNPSTGERTSPLIAGVHDITIYVAKASGVYSYDPVTHKLLQYSATDIRPTLGYANAYATFIYVADFALLPGNDYNAKERAAWLHTGLVSQNIAAYAAARGLGEKVRSSMPGTLRADLGIASDTNKHPIIIQTLGTMAAGVLGSSTVKVSAGTGGSVTGTTPQTIAFGAAGTPVTAVPSAGYSFAYWSGLPGGRVPTNPLALTNVTCEMAISAVFSPEPATYTAWRVANFFGDDLANDAVSGPAADPDSAGVTNLQRYAFALAARGRVAPPTKIDSIEDGGKKFLTITFGRRATGTGLSYVVESSPDLADWSNVRTYYPEASTPVVAQDSVAMDSGGLTRRFLRVRVAVTP
ncbi:MAG: nitroreductase family protein [Opitutaceae bacterium]|nr:nitroreductase family protein [Opitutaceae bacterium]